MTRRLGSVIAAFTLGGVIAYVDSRPTWDDTGLMVAILLLTAGALGFASPRRPWVWALALGVWIPVVEIPQTQNYSAVLALAVAFVGAYGGMAVRMFVSPSTK